MIRLGLERITRLMAGVSLPWRAVHIAGTNGKGSICASLAHALGTSNFGKIGRFTSPHLIDRWDCITIEGHPVSEMLFREIEAKVKARDAERSIGASEFELLTATAFEIFTRTQVRIAVVECGMGGLTDATNILASDQVLVTVIANISLDHQSFLGDTIQEIARQKAGIIKCGSGPCVVDGSNDAHVLAVIEETALDQNVPLQIASAVHPGLDQQFSKTDILESTQRQNLTSALCAFNVLWQHFNSASFPPDQARVCSDLIDGLKSLPGRYQHLSISSIDPSHGRLVLLDGAHNPSAWHSLAHHVDTKLRKEKQVVVWIFALSGGRTLSPMVESLVRETDVIIFTEFGPVDGMPWVHATSADLLASSVKASGISNVVLTSENIRAAIRATSEVSIDGGMEKNIVIAGSLYLVSDVLRLLRDSESSNSKNTT